MGDTLPTLQNYDKERNKIILSNSAYHDSWNKTVLETDQFGPDNKLSNSYVILAIIRMTVRKGGPEISSLLKIRSAHISCTTRNDIDSIIECMPPLDTIANIMECLGLRGAASAEVD